MHANHVILLEHVAVDSMDHGPSAIILILILKFPAEVAVFVHVSAELPPRKLKYLRG